MKTVLMVAPYFAPRRRVGALRPFRFAIHLADRGYKPVVLTIGYKPENLTKTESDRLSGIQILNIKSPFDKTQKSNSLPEKSDRFNPFKACERKITKWIDKHTPVDTWIYLMLLRWHFIRKEVLKIQPDLVWATGDPWSGLWLGEKLSTLLNVPFIADFRDPWTLANVGLRKRSFVSAHYDKNAEMKIIQSADCIVFTSDSTRSLYIDTYRLNRDKTATIYNSHHILDLNFENPIERVSNSERPGSDLHIHFFGRFRRLSPVQPIADILKVLKKRNPELASRIKIHSYGIPDQDQMEYIEEAGMVHQFVFEKPVKPELSNDVLKKADILLLSTHPERETILPAKLWEYLVSGKPILSLIPNSEVEHLLHANGRGIHCTSNRLESIEKYLFQILNLKKEGASPNISPDCIQKRITGHSSEKRTKELAAIFDRILEKELNGCS